MIKTIKGFLKDTRGGIANIFAMAAMPIALLVGGTVEISHMELSKRQLAVAVDAAVLAVAREIESNADDANALGYAYLQATLPEDMRDLITAYNFTINSADVTGSVTMSVPSMVLSFLDTDSEVSVYAEAVRAAKNIEVALVLDNTGSMTGSKIESLRTAAKDLTNILFSGETYPEYLKVSVVPYVTTVNIKNDDFSMSWMDTAALNSRHGENFDESGGAVNHFDLFDDMGQDWKGCVESRPSGFDVTDDAPTTSNAETLFVPYLWPDEPSSSYWGGYYDNNYIYNDGVPWWYSSSAKQRNANKYSYGTSYIDTSPTVTRGPNKACLQPLTSLTNSKAEIDNALNAMTTWQEGGTNGAIGLKWGWATLSPSQPFDQGAPYDDGETQKIIVMMTDGENEIVGGYNHNNSHYNSYGYMSLGHLGTTSPSTAKTKINERMETLCTNIKAAGIQMYTITFAVNSQDLKDMYEGCASNPDLYFNSPSNEDLVENFQIIAKKIASLRISK